MKSQQRGLFRRYTHHINNHLTIFSNNNHITSFLEYIVGIQCIILFNAIHTAFGKFLLHPTDRHAGMDLEQIYSRKQWSGYESTGLYCRTRDDLPR